MIIKMRIVKELIISPIPDSVPDSFRQLLIPFGRKFYLQGLRQDL